MAFELFEGRGCRTGVPTGSISSNGIYLNREMTDVIKKNKWLHVLLYFDKEARQVGLWFFKTFPKGRKAYKVSFDRERTTSVIGARTFLEKYGIANVRKTVILTENKEVSSVGDFWAGEIKNWLEGS